MARNHGPAQPQPSPAPAPAHSMRSAQHWLFLLYAAERSPSAGLGQCTPKYSPHGPSCARRHIEYSVPLTASLNFCAGTEQQSMLTCIKISTPQRQKQRHSFTGTQNYGHGITDTQPSDRRKISWGRGHLPPPRQGGGTCLTSTEEIS